MQRKSRVSSVSSECDDTSDYWHRPLLSFHQLPEWRQDNDGIVTAYRPEHPTLREALQSPWHIHNQTGNIYTHGLGALFFVLSGWWIFQHDPVLSWRFIDQVHLVIFLFGVVICLFSSTMFHTLLDHSPKVFHLMASCDYAGVTFILLGCVINFNHYFHYCDSSLQWRYNIFTVILASLCLNISFWEEFAKPKWRPWRILTFIAFGFSGLIAGFHAIHLHGLQHVVDLIAFDLLSRMISIVLFGAVIFASRFPEVRWRGKFDLWGHSHQIWHVLVDISAAFGLATMVATGTKAQSLTCG